MTITQLDEEILQLGFGDYHVHTSISIDCDEPMSAQCEAAIAAGITEIAFTEHVDHDSCDVESLERYDYDLYGRQIDDCRERYGSELTILRAAEIDWNHSIASDVAAFLARADFDFIIGSVHNLDHRYVGFHPVEDFGGFQQMFDDYFDELEGLVATGFPSVVGHCDLPRRYHGKSALEVNAEHFEERFRTIFRTAASNGVGFEINTSGIRRGNGVTYPETSMIAWFLEEGGEIITIGSDSHHAEDTGHSIERVQAELNEWGIHWRTSFVTGEPEQVAI